MRIRRPARARAALTAAAAPILLLVLAGLGCSDREKASPVGLGTLEPGRFEESVRVVFAGRPSIDTYAETVTGTGESKTLYAGLFGARPMRSLIQFGGLNPGLVSEARLILRVTGRGDENAPLQIAVHRVLSSWSESSTDATNLPTFAEIPETTVVSAPGDSILAIALPARLVQAWVDSSAGNQGILLAAAPGAAAGLRKFASSEADSGRPILRIVRAFGGEDLTDSLAAGADTYVARPDSTQDLALAGRLLVGRLNGFTVRSAFEFELPEEIGRAATVNFAGIELALDKSAFRLQDSTFALSIHEVVSSVDTSAVVFRTEPEASGTVTASSDTLAFTLTSLAGRVRLSQSGRLKVLIRSASETLDTDHIAIVSSEGAAADSTKAPRLRLVVSSPVEPETLLVAPVPARRESSR